MKWQLLFPQRPCSNHGGETRLRSPLEENETRSKHSSPEGGMGGGGGGGGTRREKQRDRQFKLPQVQ
ncbi:hypothetical protein Q5P01_002329 [Channa striata]|uniref:Uncharacterized protein n=1 Tax=Channa striata TaxID=64152 RepID=A0AA88NSJ9_CHASR|nr:hypothetical protein Q5P01_002329 [Channa striata]